MTLHEKRRKQVLLFGTSADPPTGLGGHTGIVSHLSCCTKDGYDEIRVLPVYRHMFANKRGKQALYEDRMEMCRLSFQSIPKVTVSDIEHVCFQKRLEEQQKKQEEEDEKERNNDNKICTTTTTKFSSASIRVGTADILDHLISTEPNTDFSLVLGSDTFVDLTSWKWRRSKDVVDLVGGRILVIQRMVQKDEKGGDEKELEQRVEDLNEQLCQQQQQQQQIQNREREGSSTGKTMNHDNAKTVKILNIPSLTNVSSSFVRTSNDEDVLVKEEGMLMPSVLEYIKKKKLYGFAALSTTP